MGGSIKNRIVFVTGAGGFIGRWVVKELLGLGAEIRALFGPEDEMEQSRSFPGSLVQADICLGSQYRQILRGADVVIHLAGPPSVRESYRAIARFSQVHIVGTATLLEESLAANVERFIYISSAEVYGQPVSNPVAEDYPCEVRSPYAAAKLAAEKFVEAASRTTDLKTAVLRPFSVYGGGQARDSLLGTIVRQALRDEQVVLHDLTPVRDYCHVSDVARAIALACGAEIEGPMVVNVGSGIGTSVAELAQVVLNVAGRDLSVRQAELGDRPASGTIHELVADSRRAHDLLGWRPLLSLSDGVRQTIDAWHE